MWHREKQTIWSWSLSLTPHPHPANTHTHTHSLQGRPPEVRSEITFPTRERNSPRSLPVVWLGSRSIFPAGILGVPQGHRGGPSFDLQGLRAAWSVHSLQSLRPWPDPQRALGYPPPSPSPTRCHRGPLSLLLWLQLPANCRLVTQPRASCRRPVPSLPLLGIPPAPALSPQLTV